MSDEQPHVTPAVGDFEPTLGAAAPDVEAMLPWRELIGSLASMFRLSGRVIFPAIEPFPGMLRRL